jgi:3-methyladenine DNA glycosylase AlkD
VDTVISRLQAEADPGCLEGLSKFGMTVENRIGVRVPVLRRHARAIGRDHELALELWNTAIPEARILASMIADPGKLTEADMEAWVRAVDSWDICDQVCMNLFQRTPHVHRMIRKWAACDGEYVRRAAFALIAGLAVHDKRAADETFIDFLPLIETAATDERNFVRKAVNWALRNIGKRNRQLHEVALSTAYALRSTNSRSARWIATDAIRELEGEKVQARLGRSWPTSPP